DNLKLTIHPEKTRVVHFDEGFRFLGFDFWKDYMVLPEERVRKFRDKVRHLSRRQQGTSLEEMISKLNEAIRGFANYFRIGNVKKKFKRLDERSEERRVGKEGRYRGTPEPRRKRR